MVEGCSLSLLVLPPPPFTLVCMVGLPASRGHSVPLRLPSLIASAYKLVVIRVRARSL